MTGRLAGKVAIVAGASSGLGAGLVRALVDEGAKVVPTARRAERLDELAATLGHASVAPVVGDVADPAFPESLVEQAIDRFGRLDILVTNAGISHQAPAENETTEDSFTLSVNLVCRLRVLPRGIPVPQALRRREHRQHRIGTRPRGARPDSPGVVRRLEKGSDRAHAGALGAGVRVNCVAPGWFRSEMTDDFRSEMTDDLFADERRRRFIDRLTVLGRGGGQAGELDGAVVHLAGSESSYVTGQTLAR